MPRLDRIQFVSRHTKSTRRHYVTAEDVRVLLARLPDELWIRLKKVTFNDCSRGRRVLGYTTTRGRCEISVCALPHQMTIRGAVPKGENAFIYGASSRGQWPTLAIRRFLLYHTFLHELGHLQIILPHSTNPKRKFADETKSNQFAIYWRQQLWSEPFDHPDPVHNPPSEEEIQSVRTGWQEANLAYRKGWVLHRADHRDEAIKHYRKCLKLYPDHALALQHLGWLSFGHNQLDEAVNLLTRSVRLDPLLEDAWLYLGVTLSWLNQRDDAKQAFERAIELDPSGISRSQYARELSKWGCSKEAILHFEGSLKNRFSRKDDVTHREYARHLLFRASSDRTRNTQKAIKLLNRAMELDPQEWSHRYFLAIAYSRLPKHSEQVLHHARAAQQLSPGEEKPDEQIAQLIRKAEESQ
jgi:tetratricopeptide (TPR) repeat protein